jgi:hypothetical protein
MSPNFQQAKVEICFVVKTESEAIRAGNWLVCFLLAFPVTISSSSSRGTQMFCVLSRKNTENNAIVFGEENQFHVVYFTLSKLFINLNEFCFKK